MLVSTWGPGSEIYGQTGRHTSVSGVNSQRKPSASVYYLKIMNLFPCFKGSKSINSNDVEKTVFFARHLKHVTQNEN